MNLGLMSRQTLKFLRAVLPSDVDVAGKPTLHSYESTLYTALLLTGTRRDVTHMGADLHY
jgi:hypothetical protein